MNYIENTNLFTNESETEIFDFFLKNVYNIHNIEDAQMFIKTNIESMDTSLLFYIITYIHYIYYKNNLYPIPELIQAIKKYLTITNPDLKISIKKIEDYIISTKNNPPILLTYYNFENLK
jgi:hypothetical protein